MSTLLQIVLGKQPNRTEKDLIELYCPKDFDFFNNYDLGTNQNLCSKDACVTCWTREAKLKEGLKQNCFSCARFDGHFCSKMAQEHPGSEGYISPVARVIECRHWVGGEA